MLERLRCGVIVTDAFKDWLASWLQREGPAAPGFLPELSYVRCAEGERAGQSWASLVWRPRKGLEDHEIFAVGPFSLHLSSQTRKALRERCLDIRAGQIAVI